MKKIVLILFLTTFGLYSFGITWTITNVGFTFSPATLTINQGDDVIFQIASIHTAVEVSLADWNALNVAPIIGFALPSGGGTVPASQLPIGTHYYICQNHGFMGMKGSITVQALSGIQNHKVQDDILVYPNPAKENISIEANPSSVKAIEIKLFNFQGKLVNVLLSKTEISGLYRHSFSLKNTTPGIYFVQILSDDTITYQKVVIQ